MGSNYEDCLINMYIYMYKTSVGTRTFNKSGIKTLRAGITFKNACALCGSFIN
jgi:hypothetical protein